MKIRDLIKVQECEDKVVSKGIVGKNKKAGNYFFPKPRRKKSEDKK